MELTDGWLDRLELKQLSAVEWNVMFPDDPVRVYFVARNGHRLNGCLGMDRADAIELGKQLAALAD